MKLSVLLMENIERKNDPAQAFDVMGNIMHHVVFRSNLGVYALTTSFQSQFFTFLGGSE